MITIKVGSAVLTVLEKKAEKYRAIIDKAMKPKGKWPKQANPKGAEKRDYPAFHAKMTTGEYIEQYQKLNHHLELSKCHDIDAYPNVAARLDPAYAECEESDLC
jgi:hypothetical protein